ncbi:MAG: NAD(P)H-dependent oxidoreductase subunit E [Deinococcales bacterium]
MPSKPTFFHTRAHLQICTSNQCSARGSQDLFVSVWKSLEQEKLVYYTQGGNLRLTSSGCLGACHFGPTLACYYQKNGQLEQAWYYGMDYPRTIQLARALHSGLELPQQGRFDK